MTAHYDLNNLTPSVFEQLIISLVAEATRVTPNQFSEDSSGFHQGHFSEPFVWPNEMGGDIWAGTIMIRVYHFVDAKDEVKLFEYIVNDLINLEKAILRIETGIKNKNSKYKEWPDHILFATNLTLGETDVNYESNLSSHIKSGTSRLRPSSCKLWHARVIQDHLHHMPTSRRIYTPFIGKDDVLSGLVDYEVGVTRDLAEIIKYQVVAELIADQWIRLSQAGEKINNRLSLSRVVVDLPIHAEETCAAEYVISNGDHSPSDSSTNPRRHIVLIGGPGQGKTTIGQMLCQAYRLALLRNTHKYGMEVSVLVQSIADDFQHIGLELPRCRRWPIRIDLNKYADAAFRDNESLLNYIAHTVSSRASVAMTSEQVRAWLKAWPWLLILDGLDEVATSAARETLMDGIAAFLGEAGIANADLLILATTRPQGYTGEFSADRYRQIVLSPLSPELAVWYAKRLASAKYDDDPDMNAKVVRRVGIAAAEELTSRLMRTPLQVTIMSILLEARERVPQAKYGLFEAYYDTIYAREVSKQNRMARLLENHRKNIDAIHNRLGLLLQARSEKEGEADASIGRMELRDLTIQRLVSEGFESNDAARLADEIVAAVTERLVLIVPKGIDDVGFEVRSIQEFMAARALAAGPDNAVRERLLAIASSVYWRNTWLFAAGCVFARREHFRRDIVELLIEIDNSDLVKLVVAPGADLAFDLLDDDVAATMPHVERVLAQHALTMLQQAPDADSERRASILYKVAARDNFIFTTVEQAIGRAVKASQTQNKSAEVFLRTWEHTAGSLMVRTRRMLDNQRSAARIWSSAHFRSAPDIDELFEPITNMPYLDARDRRSLETLIEAMKTSSFDLADQREVSASVRGSRLTYSDVVGECLSRPDLAESIAQATLDAAATTWPGSADLRNLLRNWLQRQPAGDVILLLTPVVEG